MWGRNLPFPAALVTGYALGHTTVQAVVLSLRIPASLLAAAITLGYHRRQRVYVGDCSWFW